MISQWGKGMSSRAKNFTEVLDEAPWSSVHWKLFAVFADNYFFDGVMFAVAPLLLYLIAPQKVAPFIFALNLLTEAAGAIVFGKLADAYGRLKLFAISMGLEAGSLVLLFPFYRNVVALAVLTSAMTFGIGGEFGAAYAMIAELIPARHRGKALLLSTNFWNIGSAVIAALSIVYAKLSTSPEVQIRYLLLTALGTALGAGLARLTLPESPRWLVLKGRLDEAESVVRKVTGFRGSLSFEVPKESGITVSEALNRYLFRFLVLAIITIAQYVTYDVAAYYIPYAPGYAFGENTVSYVVLYANIGASLGAFLLLPLIDLSRRWSTTVSFLGGSLTAFVLFLANHEASLKLFYADLLINMIFSEWAWGSLSVLQSELFPTGVRSSVVGLLTGLQGISGALIVYASLSASAGVLFALMIALWLSGLASSIAWHVRGVESARVSVEKLLR